MVIFSRRIFTAWAVLVCCQAVCATEIAPPVLPVEVFFAADAITQPTLSPTGRYLAWLQPVHDRANLMVLDRQTGRKARLTDMKEDYISGFEWIASERLIFTRRFLWQPGLSTFAINADGSKFVSLQEGDTRNEYRSFDVIDSWAADSKHILVEMERGISAHREPYSVDIYTGKATKLLGNTLNIREWITDRHGVIRLAVASDMTEPITVIYYRPDEKAEWTEIERFPSYGASWVPLGFDGDNQTLWVRSNRDRDTAAIFTYDPVAKKTLREVFADPVYDANDIIYSPNSGKVIGVSIVREGWETQWLDPSSEQLARALDQALPDTRNTIVSRARDDSAFVIYARSDRDPGAYFLFDNREQSLTRLFPLNERIVPAQMAAMKTVTFAARDGVQLHGYLTLPLGRKPAQLPLVIIPHDGEYDARDTLAFNDEVQFLANRGYAVLLVNYRGSAGYGVRFKEAGYRQWGLKMQDDLADAVHWAVAQGIVDAGRVAIYGTYYGGFAALVGLTKTPQLYACGIDREGPVDLGELSVMQRFSQANSGYQDYVARNWGHPSRDAAQLKAASPIYSVAQMRAPLLTAYYKFNSERPLLIYDHYLRLEKELKKNGKVYKSIFVENKPTGYNSRERWFGFYHELEAFLAQNLAVEPRK